MSRDGSPGHMPSADALRMAAIGALGGIAAFSLILFAQEGVSKYVAVTVAGVLLLALMPLIRNLRLFCLYLIVFLAPLDLRVSFLKFPHMGGAGAMYIDAVDPFMLLLLYFQFRERTSGLRVGYRFPPTCVFWTGMIVLGIGSVLLLDVLRISAANEVVRMLKLLLLVLVIVNELTQRRQFEHVVVALAISVILQSGIALMQYLRGAQIGLTFLGEASDDNIKTLSDATLLTGDFVYRPSGLLGHANLLAGFLALFLPMAIALLLAPVSRRLKALLGVALLVGQPTLVLTLSRAGWIDFAAGLVIVLVLGATHPVSRQKFMLARGAIIILTAIVALALSPKIIQRLYDTDPSAVEFRIRWLKTAREMIIDNPVFGVGLNAYVFKQLPYGEDKTPEAMHDRYGKYWPAVHNAWALTWAEQGTTGFALFVAIHCHVIAVAWRGRRIRDPFLHALNVGLLAGFIGIMLDGLASFFIRTEAPARTFWIATGMILAIGYWRQSRERLLAATAGSAATAGTDGRAAGPRQGKWLPARRGILR